MEFDGRGSRFEDGLYRVISQQITALEQRQGFLIQNYMPIQDLSSVGADYTFRSERTTGQFQEIGSSREEAPLLGKDLFNKKVRWFKVAGAIEIDRSADADVYQDPANVGRHVNELWRKAEECLSQKMLEKLVMTFQNEAGKRYIWNEGDGMSTKGVGKGRVIPIDATLWTSLSDMWRPEVANPTAEPWNQGLTQSKIGLITDIMAQADPVMTSPPLLLATSAQWGSRQTDMKLATAVWNANSPPPLALTPGTMPANDYGMGVVIVPPSVLPMKESIRAGKPAGPSGVQVPEGTQVRRAMAINRDGVALFKKVDWTLTMEQKARTPFITTVGLAGEFGIIRHQAAAVVGIEIADGDVLPDDPEPV